MAATDRPDTVHWREARGDDAIAIDADRYPELFEGILGKRIAAFAVDWLLLLVATVMLTIILAILGIFTLGLMWGLIGPAAPLMWLAYFTFTIGSPSSATPGMRFMGIEVRTWDGARPGYLQGALQALAFYVTWITTVFLLLVPFFNKRRRCLHDYLIGTVVINSPASVNAPRTTISV